LIVQPDASLSGHLHPGACALDQRSAVVDDAILA